jgi:hypothetical protein
VTSRIRIEESRRPTDARPTVSTPVSLDDSTERLITFQPHDASVSDGAAETENPFANPIVRHGVGATGAVTLVAVGTLYLDGPLRLLAYGAAVVDLVATPWILDRAVAAD